MESEIARRIIDILRKAGYEIRGHKDIIAALSDYEQKFDDMREYILSHKITA